VNCRHRHRSLHCENYHYKNCENHYCRNYRHYRSYVSCYHCCTNYVSYCHYYSYLKKNYGLQKMNCGLQKKMKSYAYHLSDYTRRRHYRSMVCSYKYYENYYPLKKN
jgi:hypothetical protein